MPRISGLPAAVTSSIIGDDLMALEQVDGVTRRAKRSQIFGDTDIMTSNRTYYVNGNTGNDNNEGISPGSAFKTLQRMSNAFALTNPGNFTLGASIADWQYDEDFILYDPMVQYANSFSITGNVASPQNCVINGQIYVNSVSWSLKGFMYQNLRNSNPCVHADAMSFVALRSSAIFGDCNAAAGIHVYSHNNSVVYIATNYSIDGSCQYHWACESSSLIRCRGVTITATGSPVPAFSGAFAYQQSGGNYQVDTLTFSGTATGKRFQGEGGGGFYTGTSGNLTYFPGSVAGTVLDGSNYDHLFYIPTTVSGLPTVGKQGRRAFVTDANASTFNTAAVGGSTNKVPVFDDGTTWRIG